MSRAKAAGGRNDAGFNFDFLRLAVHLLDDAVDLRQNCGNVGHDQRVGALVGNHITALAQELLDRQDYVLGVCVAEETCDADLIDCQCFGIDLCAAVLGFLAAACRRSRCAGRCRPAGATDRCS